GDCGDVENYRPITLSPVISKIFEQLVSELCSTFLCSDSLQFGFKKNLGCSHALFLLRKTIEHFNNGNSNVFIASLDASKAFDRVNHYKLFSTLMKRGLPSMFINIIINWYTKLYAVVRWKDQFSSMFKVFSGVRQGGILSPILFNTY